MLKCQFKKDYSYSTYKPAFIVMQGVCIDWAYKITINKLKKQLADCGSEECNECKYWRRVDKYKLKRQSDGMLHDWNRKLYPKYAYI